MSLEAIHDQLVRLDQQQLEESISLWDETARQEALQSLKSIDASTFQEQQRLIPGPVNASLPIEALNEVDFSSECGSFDANGLQLLAEGKAACLLVAGGQGTRLGMNGPKGCFPVSPVMQKSLFQIHAENVLYAGKRAGRPLPLVVMTSFENRKETEVFFKEHDRFGLQEDQLHIIEQENLPLLSPEGNLFFTAPGKIAQGPDGNGFALRVLFQSGVGQKLKDQGVEWITFILVDNPLADPFDPRLIGYHAAKRADVTLKCVPRIDPQEKVGVIVLEQGHVVVREYTELNGAEESLSKSAYANISLFCFSLSFAAKAAHIDLPLHQVFKVNYFKCERFIFDLLPFSASTKILVYPREECFAPLKKLDDLPLVQAKLREADVHLLERLTGKKYHAQEISRSFHYLTPEQERALKASPPQDSSYLSLENNKNLA